MAIVLQGIENGSLIGSTFQVGVKSNGALMVDATVTVGSVNTGSQAYLFGKSGADYYPLLSTSGTDGGVLRIDGSISATTGSQAYLWAKSGTHYGEVAMKSGTDNILRVAPDSWIGIGSVLTTGSVNVANATIAGGSAMLMPGVNYIGQVSGNVINTGSVAITNTVSTSGVQRLYGISGGDWYPLLSTSGTDGGILRADVAVSTGSQSYLWAKSGTHYGEIAMKSGTDNILRVSPDLWAGVGSVLVTGSVNIGAAPPTWTGIGSVLVTGSVNITNLVGSVAVTTATLGVSGNNYLYGISGGTWGPLATKSGTEAILRVQPDVWAGVGSVLVTGSVNVATPIAWTGVGSVLVNGSVNVTNLVGSVAVTSNTLWTGIGSVIVAGGSLTNLPVVSVTQSGTFSVYNEIPNGKKETGSRFLVTVISGAANYVIDSEASVSKAIKEVLWYADQVGVPAVIDLLRNGSVLAKKYNSAGGGYIPTQLNYMAGSLYGTIDGQRADTGSSYWYFNVTYYA